LGAIQAAAGQKGKKEVGERAVVHADVILGQPTDRPGYGLKVVLRVEGVEDQAILDAAHEVGHEVCYLITGIDGLVVNRCAHTVALCVTA